ncbi:MAG: CIA30 family protein [Rubritalea sp.]|uniref:CIA30 family protein n=1 Tax=Rubritalea sp. TaxID=2109375 RepID=UPI003242BD7F
MMLGLVVAPLMAEGTKVLEQFDETKLELQWQAVNDGVMGGLSRGRFDVKEYSALSFTGDISLKNNGGFSSIRSYGMTYDLSKYTGIELRVKGDGRMYYLTSRCNGGRMLAYWSPIQPEVGKWVTLKIPFSSFYATSFGRKIPSIKLNTKKVTSVGFMLYDKKAGEFKLEVDWIKAY